MHSALKTQCEEKLFEFVIITGDSSCKTKADVIVLIQDSQGISASTAGNIKTVVRRLLTLLGSETQDYNFALATYASSRRMSCFCSAAQAKSYIDTKYRQEGSGRNQLDLALSEMVLKQFNKRPGDRKGDETAKVSINYDDCFPFLKLCIQGGDSHMKKTGMLIGYFELNH